MIREVYEKGLWLPYMIGTGLLLMVLWNMVFIYLALDNAPVVRADYTETHAR